jgi:hypothetical protein
MSHCGFEKKEIEKSPIPPQKNATSVDKIENLHFKNSPGEGKFFSSFDQLANRVVFSPF